jgi:opacity protein-like surface antigen
MKKSILILSIAVALGFSSQAKAQSSYGVGIRGGVNFSKLNNTDFNPGKHTGLLLGLYFDSPIYDDLILFQPEVLYDQKGFKFGDNDFRVDYVEVPLNFRVNFVNPSGVLPYVYFGPYVAFKVNTSFPDQVPEGAQDILSDQVKTTDFGIDFGAGVDFGHLTVGVRYDAGLTDAFKDNSIFPDAKFGVFSIVAGIGY